MKLLNKLKAKLSKGLPTKFSTLLKLNAVIILLLLIVIGSCVFYLNTSFKQERQALRKKERLKRLTAEFISATNYITEEARKYSLRGDEEYYKNYHQVVKDEKPRQQIVKEVKSLKLPTSDLKLINKAMEEVKRLKSTERMVLERAEKGNFMNARSIIFGDFYEKTHSRVLDLVRKFEQQTGDKLDVKIEQIEQRISLLLTTIKILILIIPVIVILISVILYRRLTSSVDKATSFVNQIASGNLTIEPLEIKKEDEIGVLMKDINQMFLHLKELVNQLSNSIESLSAYSEQLSESADQGHETIATTNHHLQNMQSIINEISQDSEAATEVMQTTTEKVETGSSYVEETIDSIKQVDRKVEQTAEAIQDLATKSEEIDEIVELIHNIAEQTNLLALNASIEAARAGEAGQGFAVVAEEIRELAEETDQATENIANLITEIKEKSQVGLKAVKEVENKAEKRERVADKTGEVFVEIEEASQETTAKIEETAAATEELASHSEEIMDASQGVADMSDEIAESSHQLVTMAQELNELIAEFEI